jgi:hypothetical protein
MGEIRAKGEGILGGYVGNEAVLHKDTCLSIRRISTFLCGPDSDKFKYIQSEACSYDKCKFSTTQRAALMVQNEGARINEF